MEQGNRDLDLYMAQKVLGLATFYEKSGAVLERTQDGLTRPLRPYSSDIGAAWEVVRKLGVTLIPVDGGWFSLVGPQPRWPSPAEFLKYIQNTDFTKAGAALADDPAQSICLAALRATEMRDAANQELLAEAETDLPN